MDATGLGWLVASFALGGLAASVATVLTGGPRHSARATLIGAGAWYVVLLSFGQVGSLGPGLVTLLLTGFAQNVAMIAMAATLLGAAGVGFRGRVTGCGCSQSTACQSGSSGPAYSSSTSAIG